MEKKRKRASFSPTLPAEIKKTEKSITPPHTEQKEEQNPEHTSAFQQVVEVVVEESTTSGKKLEAPQINIVMPNIQKQSVNSESLVAENNLENERVRVKEIPLSSSKNEEKDTNDEEEIEAVADYSSSVFLNESRENVKDEGEHFSDLEESSETIPEEEKEARDWEKKYAPEKHAQKDRETPDRMQTEEEKQKETVEELFGKNSHSAMPEITVHKNANSRNLVLWAFTMIAVAIGVGGGLVLFTNRSSGVNSPVVATVTPTRTLNSPTAAPSPIPTNTPFPRSGVKVQVLNGGGVVGAGSKMKTFLVGKGYTVADVGNAASYTYEETEINVKETKSSIRDIIEQDLSAAYTIGKVETTLPESGEYDVRITVGKK